MRTDRLEESEYLPALRGYLDDGSAESLERAFALGRAALATGAGVLDIAAEHRHALEVLGPLTGTRAERAWEFFSEAVAPLEMALRGAREANASLRKLALDLERHVREKTRDLREAEERFRMLLEHLPVIAYAVPVGAPGVTAYVSPRLEGVLGFRPSEWLGSLAGWTSSIHDEDRERVLSELAAAHRNRAPYRIEYRRIARDGRAVWLQDEAVPLAGREGDPGEYLGILLDVTARRELEDRLRQAQKIDSVGQLAGGIAHDFNNLLTIIIASVSIELAELPPDSPQRESLDEIAAAANRAAALTRQLLTFSRRQIVQPAILDVNASFSAMEKMLRRLLPETITLRSTLGATRAILIDPGQFEQVIVNLVVNARDAIRGHGSIEMSTADASFGDGEGIVIRMRDSGSGMSEEVKARAFEPFFSTKEVGRGTGLGLATSHGIVAEAGGTIEIESVPGAGTTMVVRFPAVSAAPAATAVTRESVPRGSGRVLLVEDELSLRRATARMLARLGYEIVEATDPVDALRIIAQEGDRIDLLMTDVVMPHMTGPELAAAIREKLPRLPILFTSGYTETPPHTTEREGFLAKPFTPEHLAERLRQLLGVPPQSPP